MPVPLVAETSQQMTSAAVIFRHETLFLQLAFDAIDVRAGQIDLVDRDHDLHIRAALAWLIASSVCGMRPSSAATTSTTMSVTFAPRARIAVKAAWPGVSRKVIVWPLSSTRVGADVLRDAAGFAGGDARLADRIEQGSLAVIDVAHESDDRRDASLSSSSVSVTGGGGATTTCSTLWTPPPFSRFSFSKMKPCFSQSLRGDLRLDRLVLVYENVQSSISSLMSWKCFRPSSVARSLTMMGGLI